MLVVLVLAALAAGALMYRAQAEITAAVAGARAHQAYAAAASGLEQAVAILKVHRADRAVWYDNPELFRARLVCDDGANRWYYTIYAYNGEDPDNVRYGMDDEAGRININTADANALAALPNMTPELVDCLLDWRDADSDQRPHGAEQDYYDRLPQPYVMRNGPLATLEELLLVKGFTASVVYGEDQNLNGLLEKNEDDGDTSFPPDNGDGKLDRGLAGAATVWSYDLDVDSQGQRRTNINTAAAPRSAGQGDDANSEAAPEEEPAPARQSGGGTRGGASGGQGGASGRLPSQTARFLQVYAAEGNRLTHVAELLEARYQLKKDHLPLKAGAWVESGVTVRDLPALLDGYTAGTQPVLQGLVNVSTAPAEVLAALPGMGADLAAQVIARRADLAPEQAATTAWLVTEGILSPEQFKLAAPQLTTRSNQFRLRVVGYGWPCGQYRVIETVVDLARGNPRTVYQRDLTGLGMPLAIDVEQKGLEQ